MTIENTTLAISAVIIFYLLYCSICNCKKAGKEIRKFNLSILDIISDHIVDMEDESKGCSTLDIYIKKITPMVSDDLRSIILRSDKISEKMKIEMTDEVITKYVASNLQIYREELELAFEGLS